MILAHQKNVYGGAWLRGALAKYWDTPEEDEAWAYLQKVDVVVAPLDFSDFSDYKRRPALVVATPGGLDPVLCMITSRAPLPMDLTFQSRPPTFKPVDCASTVSFVRVTCSPSTLV